MHILVSVKTAPLCSVIIYFAAVTCPLHETVIAHGYRVGSANTFGESVTYGCTTGYIFPDRTLQIVATCTEDATWSVEPRDCKGMRN